MYGDLIRVQRIIGDCVLCDTIAHDLELAKRYADHINHLMVFR